MIDSSARILTPAIKRQITMDWHEHFSSFAIYKPMWLLRRVGPIVIGIILERDSGNDKYKPIFHIHNLIMPFETVTLTLSNQLKSKSGGPDWVTVRSHDKNYRDAILRFKKDCFLPCEGAVSFKQVLGAYKEETKRNPYESLSETDFADMALLCGWAGQKRKARKYLKCALHIMGDSDPWIDEEYGSVGAWAEYMNDKIQNPESMQKIVDEEIIKHKLQNIPVSDFNI